MEVLPSSRGWAVSDSVKSDTSVQDAWTWFVTLIKEGIKVGKNWTCLEAQADTVSPQPLSYGRERKKRLLEFTKYNYWLISSSARPVRNQWCLSWEISGVTSHVLGVPNGIKHSLWKYCTVMSFNSQGIHCVYILLYVMTHWKGSEAVKGTLHV